MKKGEQSVTITIALADGSKRSLPQGSTIMNVAENISPSLAKISLAAKLNGQFADLSDPIKEGDKIEIITTKSPDANEIIRHSTAHLMAMAIQELFPGTQNTLGPVVENQFFYDLAPAEGVRITPNEFPLIEEKMKEIVKRNLPFVKKIVSRKEAIAHFEKLGESFKVEIIQDIPEDEEIKIYFIGDSWGDLCRGPHVPSAGKLSAFKLMNVAGCYWRANKDNPQLTRVYGTAWASQKELDDYLYFLEEVKKRDHILLGKQLQLFTLLPDVAPGVAFFYPYGAKLYNIFINYMRRKVVDYGFQEVYTPQIMNASLWKTSGHYDNYKEDMYLFKTEDAEYGIKPMNCPGHVKLFMSQPRSYKDLPVRFSEFGVVHRNELSGALHGLIRVRRFTQDDGHIFCMLSQIEGEIKGALKLVNETYKDFGFSEVKYFLSTRPEKRMGSDEVWSIAEDALESALKDAHVDYHVNHGDGAFYGPKIDFKIKDALGRSHQCATIQLDFQLPERFQAMYQSRDNSQETPVMIHRAVLGSLERFMAVLIEHYSGHFPLGLSPVQCRVISLNEQEVDYADEIAEKLKAKGVRVEKDLRPENLNIKIRDAQLLKIPYMVILGKKERENERVTARHWDGQNMNLTFDEFFNRIKEESGVFWGLDMNQG